MIDQSDRRRQRRTLDTPAPIALDHAGFDAMTLSQIVTLRQIALVTPSLDPTVDELCSTLGLSVSLNDPSVAVFGLENAVMPVGDTFLEVVAPVRPDASAGRYLERRGGAGGYMVLLQVPDLEPVRARLAALGVRIVYENRTHDHGTIHLHPGDCGGVLLSFDWTPDGDWDGYAGPQWRTHRGTDIVSGIVGVELQSDDPVAMAGRWAELSGIALTGDDAIELDGSAMRFVAATDGRGPGIGGVVLRASAAGLVGTVREICGVRFSFVD